MTIAGLLMLAFTTFWSYRYTLLAKRLADPQSRPSQPAVIRVVWTGLIASGLGIIFLILVILIETARLLFYRTYAKMICGWLAGSRSGKVNGMKAPVTRLDYCQYLLVSQINYTLTNFADHCEQFSHDAINHYLRGDRITARLVWDNVRAQVVPTPQGYVVFDDTVLDKNSAKAIDLVRRQYSGNAKAVIKGIGTVTCVYVNPPRSILGKSKQKSVSGSRANFRYNCQDLRTAPRFS